MCCVARGERGELTFPEVGLLNEENGVVIVGVCFENVCLCGGTTSHVHLNQGACIDSGGRPPVVGWSPCPSPAGDSGSIVICLCRLVRNCAGSRGGVVDDRRWVCTHFDAVAVVWRGLAVGIF